MTSETYDCSPVATGPTDKPLAHAREATNVAGTSTSEERPSATERNPRELAGAMAEHVCEGFVFHDDRDWEAAVEAFYGVDRHQFAHLEDDDALAASEAYVAALWEKDRVEDRYVTADHAVEPTLAEADWSLVEDCLRERADIVGMDATYATATVEAWRRHKVGGDYWTPTMVAQAIEVRAALGRSDRLPKPKFGQSGYGHLPAYYLAGTELHDMHTRRHWRQAVTLMTLYYEEILATRMQTEGEQTMADADSAVRAEGASE